MTSRSVLQPIIALAAAIALLAACSDNGKDTTNTSDNPDRPVIVATTGMIADAARNIAADLATVHQLMGPGVDPHLYAATPSDTRRLLDADLVLYNGLFLEGKLSDALKRASSEDKPAIPVTERVDPALLIAPDQFEAAHDPHLWMDPAAWKNADEVIRDQIINIDPEHEPEYRQNAADYLAEIDEIDAYAERVLASVPPEQRVLITAHDAFNYFGERFGFEVLGIQGLSTESEAGIRRINDIVNLIVNRRVAAVFIESTVNERNVRALIEPAARRSHTVTIAGSLFSDAMGPSQTYEGTYIGMIDHNATTIARALGGNAPEKGHHGRLANTVPTPPNQETR